MRLLKVSLGDTHRPVLQPYADEGAESTSGQILVNPDVVDRLVEKDGELG